MKTITINGEKFDVIKPRKNFPPLTNRYAERYLNNCYSRPSYSKQKIFDYWRDWTNSSNDDIKQFGITSYNTFSFTLGAIYYIDNEPIGFIHITPAHNTLTLFEGVIL